MCGSVEYSFLLEPMCANVAMGLLAELHLLHLLQRGRGGGGPVVRARAKHFPGDYCTKVMVTITILLMSSADAVGGKTFRLVFVSRPESVSGRDHLQVGVVVLVVQ